MLKIARLAALLAVMLLAGSCHDDAGSDRGAIQFSSALYVVDEDSSTAQVTLERVGGTEGDVYVTVYCAHGTARQGVDVDGCGTGEGVFWNDGQSTPRTFTVAITNDVEASGHKTLQWTLGPWDPHVPYIGARGEALMVIRDDEGNAPRIAFARVTPESMFGQPVAVAVAPADPTRLYVVEQAGRIAWYEPVQETQGTFLDITTQVVSGGERGLLGIAFDPDFATNRYFYVNYTTGSPLTTRISRFTATSPTQADPGSEAILLSFGQPFDNHNGGWLGFGPDGKLYIASGDGGDVNDPQNNGQRLDTLLGKVLRINADGTVPPDNPFANDGDAATLAPIWAYGLRNPWRGGFDRSTGELWFGDVGQGTREEIDLIVAGGNYGWKVCEGSVCSGAPPANYVPPIFDYTHASVGGSASVTGGYRYRGSVPAAAGQYFYADFINGQVWALDYNGTVQANHQVSRIDFPSSFGEGLDSELYVVSYGGTIYRLIGF